jgi:hypothetical protein
MGKKTWLCRGLVLAAVLSTASMSMSANATLSSVPCSFSDLSGVTVSACSGFWNGNILSNSPAHVAEIQTALGALGVSNPTGAWIEKIGDNGGSLSVNFSTLLFGPTIVGIHFGGGARPAGGGSKIFATGTGGGTAFYLFDAGTSGLDTFGLNLTASSGVALFQTTTVTAVPEPGIYAMLALGLGVIGWATRRKNTGAGHPA